MGPARGHAPTARACGCCTRHHDTGGQAELASRSKHIKVDDDDDGGDDDDVVIVQELCESRGGRPGLSVLMSLMVSVDVKQH